MPYKVGRNSNSKGSGKREVKVTEPSNVLLEPVSEILQVEEVAQEVPVEVEVAQEVQLEEVPVAQVGQEPVFNEDKTKVFNPLSNRYVKVGGDIDKKLNLSGVV